MGKKKPRLILDPGLKRLSFPEAEKQHPWLSLLLQGYHLTDQGVLEGIRRMEKKGYRLACAKGCAACCVTHRSIPTYPLEMTGLTWYLTEVLEGELRARIMESLRMREPGDPCAFLIDGACGVHPMRPMACRQFNVFNTPCEIGEDAFYTRRNEVLTPPPEYADEAFFTMLPFYGVTNKAERRKTVEKGLIHTQAKDMQSLDWLAVYRKMRAFDRAKALAKPAP